MVRIKTKQKNGEKSLSFYHSCISAGNFTRYGYDKETETCEEFNYGGCKGDIDAFICV